MLLYLRYAKKPKLFIHSKISNTKSFDFFLRKEEKRGKKGKVKLRILLDKKRYKSIQLLKVEQLHNLRFFLNCVLFYKNVHQLSVN